MFKNNKLEKNPRWIDGRKVYIKIAFEVYKLEKKCNNCGKDEDLDIHHKDENRKNNKKSNLQVLCGFCHNSHHKKGKKLNWTVWNKGIKMPKEFCEKMSKLTSGKNNGFYGRSWNEFGGHPKGMLGKHHSEETKKRISETCRLKRENRRPQ